ncbi:hypothetical protein ACFLZJ_01600 [Nanoarchaeota archaeon]
MANKKASHVGLVLSFVIFLAFLLFMYPLIEPALKIKGDKEYLLDYLEIKLIEQFFAGSTIGMAFSYSEDNLIGSDCVKIQNPTIPELEQIFGEGVLTEDLRVEDDQGHVLGYKISGNGLIVELYEPPTSPDLLLKFLYSEFLDPSPQTDEGGCTPLVDISGAFGLVKREKWIYESKILEMIDLYATSYDGVKTEILDISEGDDFGFDLKYADTTTIGTEETIASTSIYVREVPIYYSAVDGGIKSGAIILRAW